MSDTENFEETFDKISRYLKQQEELYAPFFKPLMPDESELVQDEIMHQNASEIAEKITDHTSPKIKPEKTLNEQLLACQTLDELRAFCEYADELKTDLPNTNLVFGVGNAHADLMLIGEAPGANEDKQGEPFVGRAGQLLNKIMEAINFKREDIYIANILKHRPPENRDPLPEERERSLPYLERQIDLIQPKLILCLGLVSGHTLLKTSLPLKDLRAKFHRYRKEYELMVTYHPAALLRNPNWKRGTWEDVQMLRKRYDELNGKP